MKTRVIPTTENPWVCNINGIVYSYKAGTSQTVPDEVAELIDIINEAQPKEAPTPGSVGEVWTRTISGAEWEDVPTELPKAGTTGHFLKKTSSGCEWAVPYTLPAATAAAIGGVKQGVAVADAASTAPTAEEFKALLDSLRAAGIIATASAE